LPKHHGHHRPWQKKFKPSLILEPRESAKDLCHARTKQPKIEEKRGPNFNGKFSGGQRDKIDEIYTQKTKNLRNEETLNYFLSPFFNDIVFPKDQRDLIFVQALLIVFVLSCRIRVKGFFS
jgi:hypothetical protein